MADVSSVVISASFDNVRAADLRFADEASQIGELTVLLWSDTAVRQITGSDPKFPQEEREYLVQALRYVSRVIIVDNITTDALPELRGVPVDHWAIKETDITDAMRMFCDTAGINCQVITQAALHNIPDPVIASDGKPNGKKKVVVTGCYDWFHSGHVAFLEEVSALGDLYVVVGHDANIELLKGEGHPMFKEDERRYIIQSIRYVTQCMVSSGSGWMDAEPEILDKIEPDIYAVNEDGDKPDKREFCSKHGIEYIVLRRVPKEGLPRRESTALRGF